MTQADPEIPPRLTILPDGLGPDIVAAWHPEIGFMIPAATCPRDDVE